MPDENAAINFCIAASVSRIRLADYRVLCIVKIAVFYERICACAEGHIRARRSVIIVVIYVDVRLSCERHSAVALIIEVMVICQICRGMAVASAHESRLMIVVVLVIANRDILYALEVGCAVALVLILFGTDIPIVSALFEGIVMYPYPAVLKVCRGRCGRIACLDGAGILGIVLERDIPYLYRAAVFKRKPPLENACILAYALDGDVGGVLDDTVVPRRVVFSARIGRLAGEAVQFGVYGGIKRIVAAFNQLRLENVLFVCRQLFAVYSRHFLRRQLIALRLIGYLVPRSRAYGAYDPHYERSRVLCGILQNADYSRICLAAEARRNRILSLLGDIDYHGA